MASDDASKMTTLRDVPCPECGTPNNLSATGGSRVNVITCMACGKSWPLWKFEEDLKRVKASQGPIAKLKKAIKKKPKKTGKSPTPPVSFCKYCGGKLKNGACTKKTCPTKKVR